MKRALGLIPIGAVALCGGLAISSQDPPTTRTLTCTEAGCHADQLAFENLHGPVAAGACDMCHEYSDPAAHTFILKRTGSALCDFCHMGKTDTAGLHVHEPVEAGECLACHDPHGSATAPLLKSTSAGEMCMVCHAESFQGQAHLHTPVEKGDCLACHQAHSSILPALLVKEGRDLCLSCHANVITAPGAVDEGNDAEGVSPHGPVAPDMFQGAPRVLFANHNADRIVHEPVLGECSQCHNPHGSTEAAMLLQPQASLCSTCHADVAEKIAAATVGHSVVTADRACMNCHTPHESAVDHLLREDAIKLCLSCHEQEVQRADGSIVGAMSSLATQHTSLHDPINDGCADCHDVHGGSHANLLTSTFTSEFYQSPEDATAYALCLSCHDSKLISQERTTDATNFREGSLNLHYVHVTQPGAKGRSCRVCHDTHAAKAPHLLLEQVAYGEWRIPIGFEVTETGGSCAAGCHRPRTYDRTLTPGNTIPRDQ